MNRGCILFKLDIPEERFEHHALRILPVSQRFIMEVTLLPQPQSHRMNRFLRLLVGIHAHFSTLDQFTLQHLGNNVDLHILYAFVGPILGPEHPDDEVTADFILEPELLCHQAIGIIAYRIPCDHQRRQDQIPVRSRFQRGQNFLLVLLGEGNKRISRQRSLHLTETLLLSVFSSILRIDKLAQPFHVLLVIQLCPESLQQDVHRYPLM